MCSSRGKARVKQKVLSSLLAEATSSLNSFYKPLPGTHHPFLSFKSGDELISQLRLSNSKSGWFGIHLIWNQRNLSIQKIQATMGLVSSILLSQQQGTVVEGHVPLIPLNSTRIHRVILEELERAIRSQNPILCRN